MKGLAKFSIELSLSFSGSTERGDIYYALPALPYLLLYIHYKLKVVLN